MISRTPGQVLPTSLVVAWTVLGLAGCPTDPTDANLTLVDLKILSVFPEAVYNDGGDTVELKLENPCAPDRMRLKVGGLPVAPVTKVSADTFSFAAPSQAPDQAITAPIELTCLEHPDPTRFLYRTATATGELKYDPTLEPPPSIQVYGPTGTGVSVLGRLTVTFTRDVDPNTVTNRTIVLEGVDGEVSYKAASRTATFTPSAQLQFGRAYIARVIAGADGVRSARNNKQLRTSIYLPGGRLSDGYDEWTFETRRPGEGQPWIADQSAGAGWSRSASYKLFSVTGQASPIGTATTGPAANPDSKVQAGFIPATVAQQRESN